HLRFVERQGANPLLSVMKTPTPGGHFTYYQQLWLVVNDWRALPKVCNIPRISATNRNSIRAPH
ncbi:MAG TPA: hypothetical protein VG122_10290, partial [Gemmata sp.]|nr:hypothetical protein [Gemmata sp.]